MNNNDKQRDTLIAHARVLEKELNKTLAEVVEYGVSIDVRLYSTRPKRAMSNADGARLELDFEIKTSIKL